MPGKCMNILVPYLDERLPAPVSKYCTAMIALRIATSCTFLITKKNKKKLAYNIGANSRRQRLDATSLQEKHRASKK